MVSTDAGRAGWLLHAHLVETKLQALREAIKYNFDPNQPRVPAGTPDGGQWTDGAAARAGACRVARARFLMTTGASLTASVWRKRAADEAVLVTSHFGLV